MKTKLLVLALLIYMNSYSQDFFSESFNGNTIPTGWTISFSGGNSSWRFGDDTLSNGHQFASNAAIFEDTNGNGNGTARDNTYIIAPIIDASQYKSIGFWYYYYMQKASGENAHLKIEIFDEVKNTFVYLSQVNQEFVNGATGIGFHDFLESHPSINPKRIITKFTYDDIDGGTCIGALRRFFLNGILQNKDKITLQTSTSSNINTNFFEINNNAFYKNEKLIASHNYNPNGGSGTYHNKTIAVGTESYQTREIYNLDNTDMDSNISYNVYQKVFDSEVISHLCINSNTSGYQTTIDNPIINNDPNATILITQNFSPHNILQNKRYGVWYNSSIGKWRIYDEDQSSIIPENLVFNVLLQVSEDNVKSFKHQANAGNISNHITIIDNVHTNNNPNAKIVFTHNWGSTGNTSNVALDKNLGVYYTGSRWAIYTEDFSVMPVGALFNIAVQPNDTASIDDVSKIAFSIYPNPATDSVTIQSESTISNIIMYTILGKKVINTEVKDTKHTLDISNFKKGTYIIKLIINGKTTSKLFIKK